MPSNLPRRPGSWHTPPRRPGRPSRIDRRSGAVMFILASIAAVGMWSSQSGLALLVLTGIAWGAWGDLRPRCVRLHAPAGTGGLSYLALSPANSRKPSPTCAGGTAAAASR